MKHIYLQNIVTLQLTEEKCIGCGKCSEVCPHDVFKTYERKAQILHKDQCMECGACAINCPTHAISAHSGVGCASAVIKGWLTGKEPSCDCSNSGDCC